MKTNTMQSYSAFIYGIEDRFMADCSMLNLVSSGITPHEAVENLKQQIHNYFKNKDIKINPVFERR